MIFQYNFTAEHYGIVIVLFDGNIAHIVWVDDLNYKPDDAFNRTKQYLKELQELTKTPALQFKCKCVEVWRTFNGYNCGPSLGVFLECFLNSYDKYQRLKDNGTDFLLNLIEKDIKKYVTPIGIEKHRSLVKAKMDE